MYLREAVLCAICEEGNGRVVGTQAGVSRKCGRDVRGACSSTRVETRHLFSHNLPSTARPSFLPPSSLDLTLTTTDTAMETIDISRLKTGEVNLGVRRPSCASGRSNWELTQTSIMAVQFKDGVIVGADSRTTTGSYIVRTVHHSLPSPVLNPRPGKPRNGQADARPRPHLLLSIRVRGRHPGHRGLRPLLPPALHVRIPVPPSPLPIS